MGIIYMPNSFIQFPPVQTGGPPAQSNIVWWIDGSDLSTITKNVSDEIERVEDKSSTGVDLVQSSTALKPTYLANAVNGQSVLNFNEDQMEAESFNSAMFPNTIQAFFVVQHRSTTTDVIKALYNGQFNTSGTGWQKQGFQMYYDQYGARITSFYATSDNSSGSHLGSNRLLNTTQLLEAKHGATALESYVDTSQIGTTTSNEFRNCFNTSINVAVGGNSSDQSSGVTGEFIGYVMEIIFYNSFLTTQEYSDLMSYFDNKWGTSYS